MKKFLLFLFVLVISFSCNEKFENQLIEDEFTSILIPDEYKFNPSGSRVSDLDVESIEADIIVTTIQGQEIKGKARIVLPESDSESIVSLEFSNNLFEEIDIEPDFWISNSNARVKSSCIAHCQEVFTDDDGKKREGRGRCKLNCWIATAAAVAVAVAAIVAL